VQDNLKQTTYPTEDLSDAEVDRLRDDTPGVAHRVHLNNAGAALMPKPVVGGMVAYLQREAESAVTRRAPKTRRA
jgi:cysteine desulfurase/selenocysteine lyase